MRQSENHISSGKGGTPPGVTCPHYVRSESKRCVHYLSNGGCVRPDEFMCVEWLKANGYLAPRQEGQER